MRVLTWNLWHGRSMPAGGRDLSREFAARIAGWQWDLALLQEVPPWWPSRLARAAGAEVRSALTARNSLTAVRRAVAERRPDLIKSNGGGSNAILARVPLGEHRSLMLRRWPERRVAQLARLRDGTCVANFHASARVPLAEAELSRLWEHALAYSGGAPVILGGDLNLRSPKCPPGAVHAGRRDVDHVFALGRAVTDGAELLGRELRLEHGTVELSDHLPLLATLD